MVEIENKVKANFMIEELELSWQKYTLSTDRF